MRGSSNPRRNRGVRVRHRADRRPFVRPEDDIHRLLNTLADQFERGVAPPGSAHGVFGPDDDVCE
ncbi:MAG TPA: hypothetical protein PLA43_07060 [Bryobacteraceae bacterium]|nr:hypothetical protein [Bryobacteraceae bacterium]HPU71699.1 hypothetical protein [Bryobacteraceae bacterium]